MRRLFSILAAAALLLLLLSLPAAAQNTGMEEGDAPDRVLPRDERPPAEPQAAPPGAVPMATKYMPILVLAAPEQIGVGQPFLVRLTSDLPLESVSVHWQGKEVVPSISVWNDRHVALCMLGTDVLDAKPGRRDLTVIASVAGEERTYTRSVRLTKVSYPVQELSLPPSMVTPPKEVHERIAAEAELTAAAKNTVSARRMWRLPLERPVDGEISSLYGLRRILNGTPKNPHRGLDFRSPMGNPVKATADGVVILVGDHYYAGNSVYIDHGNGVVSMYFHLAEPTVKQGDQVTRGQAIGLSGMSGRATGPHLHFSVSVLGELVDPEPLFQGGADNLLE